MLCNTVTSDYNSIFTITPIRKKQIKNYEMRDKKIFGKEKFLIALEDKLSNLLVKNKLVSLSTNKLLSLSTTAINPIISVFLCKLINSCVSDGIYPHLLKVAEVIPIFKKRWRR